MSIKIQNVREYVRYNNESEPVTYVDVTYVTDKGFRGNVTLTKSEATEEVIIKKIREDAKIATKLIGLEIKG